MVPFVGPRKGKGLMMGQVLSTEKLPILLREDSKYALEKLSSIIIVDDYDLSNHATEVMGETGLFSIAQEMLMMKGLMGHYLNHETSLDCLRAEARSTEEELAEPKAWKVKKEAILEYRDSDALLSKLGSSFAEGFDDYLRQVKASYPDLDLAHINIDDQGQTSVLPVHSESMDQLFGVIVLGDNPHRDGESALVQVQTIEAVTYQPENVQAKERNEDPPIQ
ncbi:hypothetical protein SO802_022880 [Lithocarpus litseifolius]|uniref:Uncharacterized protein n=1 Tax=Lithocarpus litseifolius TaxID=425828 RepID=A0AAW2C513_9ROSI